MIHLWILGFLLENLNLFYIRFCNKLTKCKNYFLESRLLVHVCKAMYRYNTSLEFSSSSSDPTPGTDPSTDKKQTILINEKSHFLCKDLIKNYLVLLDDWPQPACSEFYNQVWNIFKFIVIYFFYYRNYQNSIDYWRKLNWTLSLAPNRRPLRTKVNHKPSSDYTEDL